MIAFSFIGFIGILSPLLFMYFPSPTTFTAQQKKNDFIISIPKIKAIAPIVLNVDPWNEAIYKNALRRGIAHAEGTSLPGEDGTVFLFAHSSGTPWQITRYNTIFLRIGELQKGDAIFISKDKTKYIYKVSEKKEVWPNEVSYLSQSSPRTLILQTCTPIGTSLRRLLVFAEQQ